MNDPFDFFDRIYCINLDRRPDRWERVREEVARMGLTKRVERVSAVEGGGTGCRDSHVKCIRMAQAAGASNVLVLEDDVVFAEDPRPALAAALRELQSVERWDAFYLGGQLIERASETRQHIVRAPMLQTHAIAIHGGAFERAANCGLPIDSWYARNLVSYGVHPAIAWQATDDSDVSAGIQNRRKELEKSHRVFVEASESWYEWLHRAYRTRRRVGKHIVRAATELGIPLRFDGWVPKLDAKPKVDATQPFWRRGAVHVALRGAYVVGDEMRLRTRQVRKSRPRRVLLTYWGSIEGGRPTLGDRLAVVALARWLGDHGVEAEVASCEALPSSVTSVQPSHLETTRYGAMAFVCGPLTTDRPVLQLLHRFSDMPRAAVGVSVLPAHRRALRFLDVVVARDGLGNDAETGAKPSFDLALAGEPAALVNQWRPDGPVLLCLRGMQWEYSHTACLAERVGHVMEQVAKELGRPVSTIKTVLGHDVARSEHEIERAFSGASVVLTTRLHGALLALRAGVPVVAVDQISGGAKVWEVLTALGYPHVYRATRASAETLVAAARAASAPEFRPQLLELRAKAIAMSRAALDDAGRCVEALL